MAEASGPRRNQAIVVAIIGAVGVVLAAVLPVLILRNNSDSDGNSTGTGSPSNDAASPARSVQTLDRSRRAALVMDDDFSTTAGGWTQLEDSRSRATYGLGKYELTAKAKTEVIAFLNPDRLPSTSDTLLQVDGRLSTGKAGHGYGLICKASDMQNLYRFNITNDGYYVIVKVLRGIDYALSGPSPSGAISSTEPNQMQVLCVSHADPPSTELRLWVNGRELITVVDRARPLNGNQVGLYARDTSGGGTKWEFDNFQLWELEA